MTATTQAWAMARLDLAEVVRSRWLLVCLLVYAGLAGVFVLVGMRESSVMGFTGMGRVLFSLCHALVLVLPLIALAVTAQVINRAREEGALELFLSHPISRRDYFVAVTSVRYLALAVPLVLLLVALAVFGRFAFGQPIPWSFVARSAAVSASLLWVFTALGIAISTRVRNPARATTYLILVWALCVALLDFALIGMMLSWKLHPQSVFVLAGINPVQMARLALLSAAQPDLASLGPVGFYLVHRLGPGPVLALGVGWPLVLGTALWWHALRRFRRGDIV